MTPFSLSNRLHAMSGATAFAEARSGLLAIAAYSDDKGRSAVALILLLHLVQDHEAHTGMTGLYDHFKQYGFGDADPKSLAGDRALEESAAVIKTFKELLVKRFGDEGAEDFLLGLQARMAELDAREINKTIEKLSSEIKLGIEIRQLEKRPSTFIGASPIREEQQRQCGLGNPAACPD